MPIFGFCPPSLPEIVIFFARENSLSQNLTVLTAPSGREPLARPQAFCFNRKLCRYAKGPIPEGAVAVGDWGSSGKRPRPLRLCFANPHSPFCRFATSSPGAGEVFPQRERPWQRDEVCGDCQGLPLWGSWQNRQALTERASQLKVFPLLLYLSYLY